MLIRIAKVLVFGVLVSITASCAHDARYPMGGIIYHDVKGPNDVVLGKQAGTKKGNACATNILGYVAFGDASIAAAKKNGGITEVSVVDYSSSNIIGVYGTTCTVVHGS
ncbi:MAG: TRL-like family protein [Proteobacteria bacterium]|nr:TRL-like family protein [Pseudomonadota bacterium]